MCVVLRFCLFVLPVFFLFFVFFTTQKYIYFAGKACLYARYYYLCGFFCFFLFLAYTQSILLILFWLGENPVANCIFCLLYRCQNKTLFLRTHKSISCFVFSWLGEDPNCICISPHFADDKRVWCARWDLRWGNTWVFWFLAVSLLLSRLTDFCCGAFWAAVGHLERQPRRLLCGRRGRTREILEKNE